MCSAMVIERKVIDAGRQDGRVTNASQSGCPRVAARYNSYRGQRRYNYRYSRFFINQTAQPCTPLRSRRQLNQRRKRQLKN